MKKLSMVFWRVYRLYILQIEDNGYAVPYAADRRTIIKIGANFDSASGTLDDWKEVR